MTGQNLQAVVLQALRELDPSLGSAAAAALNEPEVRARTNEVATAIERLIPMLGSLHHRDTDRRQRALDALHARWHLEPASGAELRRVRDCGAGPGRDLIDALIRQLDAPGAPDEADFGAALTPHIDAMEAAARRVRQEADRLRIRRGLDELLSDMDWGPMGTRR